MNRAIRLLMLSAAACAAASSFTPAAAGQSSRRATGNPADVERVERERRDRETQADLSERQFLLRTMEADRRPVATPKPKLPVAQIREDFTRLQIVNNDLARSVSRGEGLDLKFVSGSAAEIRKIAARLRDNLALPEPGEGDKSPGAEADLASAQLRPALSTLDGLILRFADDLASRGIVLIDAQSSVKVRRALEEIIVLSDRVKKISAKLRREQ